jgi:uncharacterized protein (DUF2267 family)
MAPVAPAPHRADADLLVAAAVLVWVPLLLALDRHATLATQTLLGLATWALLVVLGRGQSPEVRAQIAVVVLFATAVEYTFSALLQVYVYRLGNVPSFVPPGHGLVYLAALSLGRSRCFRARERVLVPATVVAGGAYAVWGLLLAGRRDALGAFWFLCLLGFIRWGRSALLYVGAFVVVTYLELIGTGLGIWRWHELDPTGVVTIGNPPTGVAGGYGWFDLAAVTVSPALLRLLRARVPSVTWWTPHTGKHTFGSCPVARGRPSIESLAASRDWTVAMDFKQFVQTVAERAALSREEAADVTRATLETLGERLSAGELRQFAVVLPEPMSAAMQVQKRHPEKFGLREFVEKVSKRTGLKQGEADAGVRAVFITMRETVEGKEFNDVLAQLPGVFSQLAEATA